MSEILEMHPARIKPRDIARIVETLRHGGVVIAPSDSGYALLCQLDDKPAAEKIRHIRELERDHPFTIICADLTDLARYARVDNVQFRLRRRYSRAARRRYRSSGADGGRGRCAAAPDHRAGFDRNAAAAPASGGGRGYRHRVNALPIIRIQY